MKFFILSPEVAGEIGENSILTYENGRIKDVIYLDYCFMGWLGDELLSQHPCFIITKSLQADIIKAGLTGISFSDISISFSEEFEELFPNFHKVTVMPEFVRIQCDNFFEDDKEDLKYDFYFN